MGSAASLADPPVDVSLGDVFQYPDGEGGHDEGDRPEQIRLA